MNYQPKVTIIIPVYNGSNFLAQAIDAALAQTYKNCEIIVINDGSKDDGASEKIALSYGDKIRYFLKENGGVSSALNFAFTKMTGEWFSWLSHDDLYYPEKIEKQINFINRLLTDNPQINLNKITVRSATESIDRDGKVIKRPSYRDVPEYEKPIDTILNNIANYRLSGCSFLLPKSCISDVGNFNENIRTVSDVEFWYRLLFAGYEFYCLSNDVLVKNRSHGKQVGKTKVQLFELELNQLHKTISDNLMSNKEFYSPWIAEKLYLSLVSRRMIEAAEYIRRKYITSELFSWKMRFSITIKALFYKLKGNCRNIARFVFRKIMVK